MMKDTSQSRAHIRLDNCEAEELHLSGRIQGHGALLVVDLESRLITHASANCPDVLGLEVDALVSAPLFSMGFYTPEIMSGFSLLEGCQLHVATVQVDVGRHLDLTLIRTAHALLMEWQPVQPLAKPVAIFQMQRSLARAPSHKEALLPYFNTLVQQTQQVSGLDRVMLYRFRSDWTGVVEAEACEPRWGSYLGLRFPAADIPKVARDLYMQTPFRMIPDVDAPTHGLWSLDDDPPDLSLSELRSVSPMHLEYLHNMGVRASFSVPVVVGEKLWGLVACHHYQGALRLSHDQRQACVSMAGAFSLGLASYVSGKHLQLLDSLDRRIDQLVQVVSTWAELFDSVPLAGEQWAACVDADGFALALDDRATLFGATPSLEGLGVIDEWFLNACDDVAIARESMPPEWRELPHLMALDGGLQAAKVWHVQQGWLRLYWFRHSEVQRITWAGQPDKPAAEDARAASLSPRRSFERWVETRTGHCAEWTSAEKLLVTKIRTVMGRMR
ncbi:MAG: GAF domain-containing protein [Rhodoferax sp.]|nr:GAF domain-containing protein [Rhodoferax sp.]